MKRITFEEYTNAIDLIIAYKEQCKNDINITDVSKKDLENIRTDIKNARIGQKLIVRRDSSNTSFKKGETYEIIDNDKNYLVIRKKNGILARINKSNGASRWGYF